MFALRFLLQSSAFISSPSIRALPAFFMTNDISTQPDPPTITTLLDRSLQLRQKLFGNDFPSFLSDATQLAYPSSYKMQPDPRGKASKAVQRGFCNWLVPNYIMIGQYPGMTPESNGPSQTECNRHIENMVVDANVSLFCCLQSEVPCQSDDEGWTSNEIYLEPYYRREFPRPFTRYGRIAQELTDRELQFIHNPIDDLSVPTCNNSLLNLLSQLIRHLEVNDDGAMFIHCWGGRGRAGLIGSCLISLLFPELNSKEVLDFVQKAYSTREGADSMLLELRQSPQTEQQRLFVTKFVRMVNDVSMRTA